MPHIHELVDFTSEVFIVHKEKVFLRMHDKYKFWLSVGGHIELHEDPAEAAVREVREEVGLEVKLFGEFPGAEVGNADFRDVLAPQFMCRHRVSPTHEHVTSVYFATCENAEVKIGEGEKETEWKWFSAAELADPAYGLKPNVRFYAEQALLAIGNG